MAQDIQIAGATFNAVPSIVVPVAGGGSATFVDPSPTTAAAADVASGKLFFSALGVLTQGTASGGGGGAYSWFGENAEKVSTVINKTINLKNDTIYDSWTASTTATTIKAASSTADYTLSNASGDYDYCFLMKAFCQPVYKSGATLKSTAYRFCYVYAYAFWGYADKTSMSAMETGSPISSYTNNNSGTYNVGYYYYNNNGTLVTYNASYGPMYIDAAPTFSTSVSSGKLNSSITLPAIKARCNSSRFATARKTEVDSENTNMIITVDLIRCPRGKSFGSAQFDMVRAELNAP